MRLRAVGAVLSLVLLLTLGPLGIAPRLRDAMMAITAIWQLQILLFFAILAVAVGIVEAPLTYVSGFVLPHRYSLSNQTLAQWLTDVGKGIALAGVLGAASVEILYGFLRWTPDTWWLWTGIIFTFFTVVLSALAPVLILPLFFRLSPLRNSDLTQSVSALAARAGTRVAAICEIDLSSKSPAANAAVIGLGTTRKIVLGDTLLEYFPPPEVEVVVAHELGHHVHHDLPRGLLLESALTLAGFFLVNLALHAAVREWHFAGVWDLGAAPVLGAALGIWSTLTGPVARWYSRRREAAADAYSLELTGDGTAFVNSEVRLTNQNLGWLDPPVWLEALTYTHPAPWRRIEMGRRYLVLHASPE